MVAKYNLCRCVTDRSEFLVGFLLAYITFYEQKNQVIEKTQLLGFLFLFSMSEKGSVYFYCAENVKGAVPKISE